MATMREPQEIQALKSVLGMVSHIFRFLPNLSQVLPPLRDLVRTGVEWQWGDRQRKSFQTVLELIVKSPVLAFFDVRAPVEVECDASQYALGVALNQNGKTVYFASRTLTPTEAKYAQIEKELLAIVFALRRFQYL